MDVTLEQVERLREKAKVSYEDAKWALEQADGDLLAALIVLERAGKIPGGSGGAYSTHPGGADESAPHWTHSERAKPGGTQDSSRHARHSAFWADIKNILKKGLRLLGFGMSSQFEIWRRGELLTCLPVLILIVLVVAFFWVTVPLIVIGLLFGCSYRVAGTGARKEEIDAAIWDFLNAFRTLFHRSEDSVS